MKNIKFKILAFILIGVTLQTKAQQTDYINDFITWEIVAANAATNAAPYLTFDKARKQNVASNLPYYTKTITHGYDASIKAEFNSLQYSELTTEELALLPNEYIPYTITPTVSTFTQNKKPAAAITFLPLVRDAATGKLKKVTFFSLKISFTPTTIAKTAKYTWASASVLEKGDWIRIETKQNGVHKIDANFLNSAGLNATGANISTLRLYGNGGGMLPQRSADINTDDLIENAIEVRDINQNGLFDGNDYILFYAEGANKWEFDAATKTFKHRTHRYANANYYFITIGAPGGKRIAQQNSENGTANHTTTTFDELFVHEYDDTNFLKSGRDWYGEEFNRTLSYDFKVSIPDRAENEMVKLRSQAVARSGEDCRFIISNNSTPVMQHPIPGIVFRYELNFTNVPDTAEGSFMAAGNDLNIRYTFDQKAAGYKGWLNFFELTLRRKMKFSNGQVIFRDSKNIDSGNLTEFVFDGNGQDVRFWEITNPLEVTAQQTNKTGNNYNFTLSTSNLREFVAFNENTLLIPDVKQATKIENQNLHALRNIEMVIVTHLDFLSEAQRLAKHHETHDNLNVAVVTVQQIFNEFSSGKQDVSAIRNMMKMLYDQTPQAGKELKYLLMFGDASYDYKNIKRNNTNFVPTYQSRNTYSPTNSYCSDDYYTQLDDDEGLWGEDLNTHETVDIGVGRFPVQTQTQARQMVDKVIAYTNQKAFGDWRNNVCFIADDEDGDRHFKDAQDFAGLVEKNNKEYNVDKIYLDGYKEISVGSGSRYPEVNDQINRKVDRGALVINYSGHGGELGLAHEQILDVPMINAWKNINNMPLFVTATCEFSRFDDPARTSAGELVLLNPNGGGIALLTTVRLVYQWPNYFLNYALYNKNIFTPLSNGEMPRLGDVYRKTKNGYLDLNSRNFTLLGDPAVRLAYPQHKVITTEINGIDVSSNAQNLDTIGALSQVTIKGYIADANGNKLSNYNGIVYPTVFDKLSKLSTLANDPESSKQPYSVYKNIIYKGKSSVTNGDFEYSFFVPQDISYSIGNSKISYYATDNSTDANGFYDSIIITGTDNGAPIDKTGPSVRLYMNDTTFRFGGVTDENPTLLVLVSDLHGVSTTGNGIGRDMTAILDNDRRNILILNDYYEAKLNSYQEGEIKFPLYNLKEGFHNVKVKVWDVYNNPAEAYTEFFVAKSDKLAIKQLINYPNPFSQRTKIFFEHNKQGQELYVDVDIYSTDGKLIKTLSTYVPAADASFDSLEWNVAEDYGNKLAQGIYLFKVKVRSGNDTVEETQKMVLIK